MKKVNHRKRKQLRLLFIPLILILVFFLFKGLTKPSISKSVAALINEAVIRKPLISKPIRDRNYTKTHLSKSDDKVFFAVYPRYEDEKIDKVIENYIQQSQSDEGDNITIDYEESGNTEVRNVRFLKRCRRGKKDSVVVKTISYNVKNKEIIDLDSLYTPGMKEYLDKKLEESEVILASAGNPSIDLSAFEDFEDRIDFVLGVDEQNKLVKLSVKKEEILPYNREEKYYRLEEKKGKFFRQKGPMIALTFDDGPHSELTPEVLKVLKENNAKATFYVMGCHIPGNEDILKQIVKQKCEIGNHSMNHPELTTLTDDEVKKEMNDTDQLIHKITGVYPKTMRPPFGDWDQRVAGLLKQPIILWSIDTYDWYTQDPQATIDTVLENVKEGDIILLHDVHATSIEAAKVLIPELKKRGFQLVTVSELWRYYGQRQQPGVPYTSLQ